MVGTEIEPLRAGLRSAPLHYAGQESWEKKLASMGRCCRLVHQSGRHSFIHIPFVRFWLFHCVQARQLLDGFLQGLQLQMRIAAMDVC